MNIVSKEPKVDYFQFYFIFVEVFHRHVDPGKMGLHKNIHGGLHLETLLHNTFYLLVFMFENFIHNGQRTNLSSIVKSSQLFMPKCD
jgi:hypothetical protein